MSYPKSFYISSGVGKSKFQIVAFDKALHSAGIANYNLTKISSRLPCGAVRAENVSPRKGDLLPTAYGRIDSNEPGTQIAAAVGVAIPCSEECVGAIMETSGYFTAAEAEAEVRAMCAETMDHYGIAYKEILVSSSEAVVEGDEYTSVVAAISIW